MSPGDELVHVHLVGLPVRTRTRFLQHLRDLSRELSLVRIGAERGPGTSLPPRLLHVAAELDGTYAAFRAGPDAVVEAAAAAGQDFCDVTYTVPPSAAPFLQHLGEVLEEADEFCRGEAHLLSLPAPEDVVAYRRWVVSEPTRQLAGQAPRPWRPLPSQPARADAVPPPGPPPPTAEHPSAEHLPPGHQTTVPAPRPDDESAVRGGTGEVVRQPLVLEPTARSAATARRYVREAVRGLGAEELEESAELGVSELVANAVLHARTAFTLTVGATVDGRVRVAVTDSSSALVRPRHLAVTSTTGRGLQLVASVSSAWGVDELPADRGPGKTVWFEPSASTPQIGPFAGDWALELDALR